MFESKLFQTHSPFFIERECKDSGFINMEMRHHLQVAGSGPECLQQMTAFYTPSAVTKHILKGHTSKLYKFPAQ